MYQTLRRIVVFFTLLSSAFFSSSASALGIPVVGWGYSIGNGLYVAAGGDRCDPGSALCGRGWLFDPPQSEILSGRLTAHFDPSWTVGGAGWFGEFGMDPNIPAPAIGATEVDYNALLQTDANPAMQSSNIIIDQLNGVVTFEFDWGPLGFEPTMNMDPSGHFNFAGIWFDQQYSPLDTTAPYGVVGSPAETATLGTQSSTYMLCRRKIDGQEFYCGAGVPEPPILALLSFGLVGAALFRGKKA